MKSMLGETSRKRLDTCDPILIHVLTVASCITNFTVVCGHRGMEEQTEAFMKKLSKTPWPQSKHNAMPSQAVDIAPYDPQFKILWGTEQQYATIANVNGVSLVDARRWVWQRYAHMMGVVKGVAAVLYPDVVLRWGNDWDSDENYLDQTFVDMPHIEVVLKE